MKLSSMRRASVRISLAALLGGVGAAGAAFANDTPRFETPPRGPIGNPWSASFDSESSEPLRLERHVSWELPNGVVRHEWLVAIIDPRQTNWAALWLQNGGTHGGGNALADSWNQLAQRDWSGRFHTRWGDQGGSRSGGGVQSWLDRYCVSAVPEPATAALMLAGVISLGWTAKRRGDKR